MPFGQVIVGPPGSGKTTYCWGAYQYLTAIGRKVAIVNLDPANDNIPYPCINRKEITQSVLSNVLVYIGEGRVLPAKHLLQAIKDPQIRASIIDFVCAVGLGLAYSILISF
ncbi:Putative Yor262w protein [Rhizopus microsporus]|nr:Putative Yor262w protein [Rhizopus microsporus]